MRILRWLMALLLLQFVVQDIALAADTQVKRIRYSAHGAEKMKGADAHTKFLQLLNMPGTLSQDTLQSIDFEVRRLAFYRTGDRQNKKFPRDFYESLEQNLIDKFVAVKRFSVHECFECRITKVLVREDKFSIMRQLESNESFAEVGRKIGVDHFVLWDAFVYQNEPVINVRIVSAETGQVRWSQQYQGERKHEFDWEFYTSIWGLEATREAVTADEDAVASPMIALGLRALSRSTLSSRIFYGYGGELFFNTTDRDVIDVYGFSLNGRLAIELDPALGIEQKNYGNWLVYISVGQAFLYKTPTLISRAGFELRMNKSSFIDFGVVTIKKEEFEVRETAGYAAMASMGGSSYDLTLGYRF